MPRDQHGLLIDFEWCTGCHACEIAGKFMNNLKADQKCIDVGQGKRQVGDRVVLDFIPRPTELCHLCAPRTAQGKLPACVHHCPPQVIRYGTRAELEEAAKAKPNQILWFPDR
ncbi:MAG TPA: oxidoreductase [Dehalococcoidia bacterium]|nr:oxidoreductase [Dehalococcoidia bacterium]